MASSDDSSDGASRQDIGLYVGRRYLGKLKMNQFLVLPLVIALLLSLSTFAFASGSGKVQKCISIVNFIANLAENRQKVHGRPAPPTL